MASAATIAGVSRLVAEVCGVPLEAVRQDEPLIRAGIDSVRVFELVIGVEDVFGVKVPDHRVREFGAATVEQLAEEIEKLR